MKTIQLFLSIIVLALLSLVSSSCTGPAPVNYGGGYSQGGGEDYHPYAAAGYEPHGPQHLMADNGQQSLGNHSEQVSGQSHGWYKVDKKQLYMTKQHRGAEKVRIQADAPPLVSQQVKDCVGHWCERVHSSTGVWPNYSEAVDRVKQEFAQKGYYLHLTTNVGEDKGFAFEYTPTDAIIGEPVAKGVPETTRTNNIQEDDVPASIRARSQEAKVCVLWVPRQEK